MRVLFWTASFLPTIGGAQWVIHHLGNALTLLGHKVTILAPRDHCPDLRILCNYSLERYGFLPFPGSGRLGIHAVAAILKARNVLKTKEVDVVHVHTLADQGTAAHYFAKMYHLPVVGTPHGAEVQTLPEVGYGYRLDRNRERQIRRNAQRCARLTAVSDSMRQVLAELESEHDKIVVVPNGIWWEQYQRPVDRRAVRQKFGLPQDDIIVISIGRNHVIKGFRYGVEALARWVRKCHRIHYLIVGGGTESLRSLADHLGVSDYLHLPGELLPETVTHLYQAADVFLSTSLMESFGLSFLEAMASGLSSVVTNVPGNKDLAGSEYSLRVSVGDLDGMARAIWTLAESPSLREAMGRKARLVAKGYDWIKVAQLYEEVYRDAELSLIKRSRYLI